MQSVEVKITPSGKVEIHVQGVQGMDCTKITEKLEFALGGKVERELTDESQEQPIEQSGGQTVNQ